jgi:hypothetical protein
VKAFATCAVVAAALVLAGGASANPYVGTLGDGGTASIAGTLIKCKVGGGSLGCVVTKGGNPDPKSWAFTIDDSRVQAGKVSASSAAYTSPKQPKPDGAALTGKAKSLTVRVGQNFGMAGSHVGCSVLKVDGKIGVACTLVGSKGAWQGAYGAYITSHALQVRTTEGAKSKVLFSRTF